MIVIRKTPRCCQCCWYWPDNKMARAWKGSPGGKFFKEEMEWNKSAKATLPMVPSILVYMIATIINQYLCISAMFALFLLSYIWHFANTFTGLHWLGIHSSLTAPSCSLTCQSFWEEAKNSPKKGILIEKSQQNTASSNEQKYQNIIWISGHRVSPDCAGSECVIWNRDQMILKLYLCWAEAKENNRLRAEEFAVRAWNVHIVPAPSDTDQWSQARMLEQDRDAKDLAGIKIGYSSPPTHPAIYIWSHNWTRKVREITLFSAPCTVYCRRDCVSLESEYGKELT